MKQLIIIALLGISISSIAQIVGTTTPNGTPSKSIKWEDGKKVINVFDSVITIDAITEKEILDIEANIKKSDEYRLSQIELEKTMIKLLIRRKYNTDSVELKRYEKGKLIVKPKH